VPPTSDNDRHRVPGTGMGGGVVPPYWGPDSPEDSGSWSVQEQPTDRPGATWLRLGVLVGAIVLVVLAAIVALSFAGRDIVPGTGGSDEPTGSAAPAPTPVEATVTDFDPEQQGGTPSERPEQVPLATDGDKGTAWTTEKYFDGPRLAPYKAGVGLLFDLGKDVEVRDLVADLGGEGYGVQLLAAPEGTTAKPTSTEGLTVVASRQGVGGHVVLGGDEPVTTRYVVLWLTALPSVSGGFQGSVLEADVRS
jgi:putative peptidoglycan lipid II flippase